MSDFSHDQHEIPLQDCIQPPPPRVIFDVSIPYDNYGFFISHNQQRLIDIKNKNYETQFQPKAIRREKRIENKGVQHFFKKNNYTQLHKTALKGFPTKFRAQFWKTLLHTQKIKQKLPQHYLQLIQNTHLVPKSTQEQIKLDVKRTFPENILLKSEHAPAIPSLHRILLAFALRHPDIGYCQSLNFIAATFLISYLHPLPETDNPLTLLHALFCEHSDAPGEHLYRYCEDHSLVPDPESAIFQAEEDAFWSLTQFIASQPPSSRKITQKEAIFSNLTESDGTNSAFFVDLPEECRLPFNPKCAVVGLRTAGYYRSGMAELKRDLESLWQIFSSRYSRSAQVLEAADVDPLMISSWLLTCGTSLLCWPVTLRVFDMLLLDGRKALMRIGLALLRHHVAVAARLSANEEETAVDVGVDEVLSLVKSTGDRVSVRVIAETELGGVAMVKGGDRTEDVLHDRLMMALNERQRMLVDHNGLLKLAFVEFGSFSRHYLHDVVKSVHERMERAEGADVFR